MTMTFRRTGGQILGMFLAVLIMMMSLFAFGAPRKASAATPFTVYLQAGHSPSALGSGNIKQGIKESVLNEQLTQRVYKAIKDKGINVKLLNPITLDSTLPSLIKAAPGEKGQYAYYSPEPAMLTALTWPERFDSSVHEQGDLVLSLHHNSYADPSIRGYEVYYANSVGGDYGRTADAAAKSKQAAELVGKYLAQASFGIPARTPAVRMNNSHNGLTKNSPVPSVLLETGYMSNASDLAACRQTGNQEKVAAQLAEAVVAYQNTVASGSSAAPSGTMNAKGFDAVPIQGSEEGFAIRVVFDDPSIVRAAAVGVFPADQGESAMKMYSLAPQSDKAYTANISLKDFGSAEGRYAFRLYGTGLSGDRKYLEVIYSEFRREAAPAVSAPAAPAPSAATPSVVAADAVRAVKATDQATEATLQAVNVTSTDAAVTDVRFAVWSRQGGQDDIRWYPGTADGRTWSVRVSNADHGKDTGAYIVHVYASTSNGADTLIGYTDFTLGVPAPSDDVKPPVMNGKLTANLQTKTDLTIKATQVMDRSGVDEVRFAFWSQPDQSDLKWYKAAQSGNDWSAEISLMEHPSLYGNYTVHAYATDARGNDGLLGGEVLQLGSDLVPPKAGRISAEIVSSGTNLAILRADDVTDADSGVLGVRFAVWTQHNGNDDLVWYDAEPGRTEGSWDVMITGQKHNDEKGPYVIEAYGTDKAGNTGLLGSTVFTFESGDTTPPRAEEFTTDQQVYTKARATATVKNVTDDTGVASVRIAVWSDANGKGDMKWYTAKKSGLNWNASFSWAEDFMTFGTFHLEAFATDYAGNEASVGKVDVEVRQSVISGTPIMGKSEATTAQLVNYMLTYGWDNDWYDMTVDDFCQIYMDVCEAEGVKAEIAFAQMIHETGGLRYGNLVERDQYNFAGLGSSGTVTAASAQKPNHAYTADGRDRGLQFKTVEDGIKSHVQHLKCYASKDPLNLPMAEEYDRYGNVEPGSAPTVEALAQKWATSDSYALKMLLFVESILGQSKQMPEIEPIQGGEVETVRSAEIPVELTEHGE